jgi:tRNA-specific 2-thiouridylase
LFPLHGFTKNQIRKLAAEKGLIQLSEKRESQEICFIPDNNYRNFIKNEYPDVFSSIEEGDVLDKNHNVIGRHRGFLNYTIGQRKGLGIAMGEPVYVTDIQPEFNTITLGKKEDLLKDTFTVEQVQINKFEQIPEKFSAEVKIRYNTHRVKAQIQKIGQKLQVQCETMVSAVTPGQSAVFYQDDECIGGGIITR